jgi:hypothetical protein
MRDHIGVIHSHITPINLATNQAIAILKRLCLFFDRIAVVDMFYPTGLCHYPTWEPTRNLIKKGIMYDPNYPHYNASKVLSESNPDLKELWELYENTYNESRSIYDFEAFKTGKIPENLKKDINRASELYIAAQECLVRCISASINQSEVSTPILQYFGKATPIKTAEEKDVVDVVINSLPLPSPNTPWEKIFEFRNDEEARGDLAGLRNWINETARLNITVREVEEKLEWLIHRYKKHIERHRMEIDVGTFESVFTVGTQVLENVAKLKLSKAVKALFSLERRKVELLKAELSAPNPEIAFIVKSAKKFS